MNNINILLGNDIAIPRRQNLMVVVMNVMYKLKKQIKTKALPIVMLNSMSLHVIFSKEIFLA
ncbi:hypothetical protein VI35_07870 [Aeromonas caviae]|nr:hypothetical protein VI35_07870 [Aeromonas caviae]